MEIIGLVILIVLLLFISIMIQTSPRGSSVLNPKPSHIKKPKKLPPRPPIKYCCGNKEGNVRK